MVSISPSEGNIEGSLAPNQALIDGVIALGFVATLAVAIAAYAVRYVPGIDYDGPDRVVFLYYFFAMGLVVVFL